MKLPGPFFSGPIVMATSTTTVSARASVIYDGECPLCLRSVALLKQLDWLHKLDYVNARDESQAILRHPLVALAPLLEEMHLVTPDGARVHHGFGAFRWMAWRLPALWLLAPLLYLPGVPWLGQRIYLWIARNRYHIVPCHQGVCEIEKKD
jgi:predicted DCC family thiol-disulfide oxidoreductase YuxK